MHVKRYGTGTEQVFLAVHGWAGNHRTFAPLARHLPDNASILAVDLPGYGKSSPPPEWRMESVVDGLVEAARQAPGGPITFMGLCSGAVLALMAAKETPERAARVVMIDPFAYVPWYFRIFLWGSFGYHAYHVTFANSLGRRFTNRSLARRRTGKSNLTKAFAQVDHSVTLSYLRMFNTVDAVGPFKEMRLPIDIAYGERTFAAVKDSVKQWRAQWPQARAWELPGAGHQPIEEAGASLAEVVFEEVPEEARTGAAAE